MSGLIGAAALRAQPDPVQNFVAPIVLRSGVHANPSAIEQMVWQQPVQIPGAASLKLHFTTLDLPGSSRVEITSFRDCGTQTLDARLRRHWFPHSAYFNGDAVLVRLFAGAYTSGVSLEADGVEVGLPPAGNVDSICPPTDDRVLSSDRRVGRLMPAGCTGFLGTSLGLVFTAGHCSGTIAQLIEFNVPLSGSSGAPNHPPPEDQFPLVLNLGGISNPNACDWAVYVPGTNHLRQTPLQRQNGTFTLATQLPAASSTLRITGYGMHLTQPNWSQAQKTTTGPLVATGSGPCGPYLLRYQVDSISGDSGSPVIEERGGTVIGIHSGGDCAGSLGANQGSAITNADLQRILQNPSPQPPAPLAVGDLVLSHAGFSLGSRLVQIDVRRASMATFFGWGAALCGLTMAPNNAGFLVCESSTQDSLLEITSGGGVRTLANLGAAGTPTAIERDQDGTLLVSSTDNHLRRVTPGGIVTTVLSLPVSIFDRTNDIARDPDTGDFVVGVWRIGELYEIDAVRWAIRRTIASGLSAFYGVDVEPRTGNYVVISYAAPEVRVYSRSGTVLRSWSFPHLDAVEVDDGTGNYLCAGFGHVVEFRPDGAIAAQYGPYAAYSFNAIERYGSKSVTGSGSARPGTTYRVDFRFPGLGSARYIAALSQAQRPGIAFSSGVVNLAPDALYHASLAGLFVQGFAGTLDPFGAATGTVAIPAHVPPGFTFFCAAIALQGGTPRLGNTIGITVR
ncbi:MAG: hypothetical protein JXQ29_16915 [Planctomycetes bacterium]|nr:hypothetical protein [Planctomycetota bacterium]